MSRTFGEIRQITFVVHDIDHAMDNWSSTLGIGPFFIKREIHFSDYRYHGKPAPSPCVSIALSNSGPLQIELIQQHDEQASIYKAFLDSGREGLQHVAAWLDRTGFDQQKERLRKQGYTLLQECTIPASGVRLAYFATDTIPGGFIYELADLLEPTHAKRLQNIVDSAANWDGKQAIREVTQ